MTTLTTDHFVVMNAEDLIAQIGAFNIMAISGGRVVRRDTGITLPVAAGYSVTIDLDFSDTYVVRRVFTRAGKTTIKGQRNDVYFDEVGQAAYYASCFRSYDAQVWPTKR